MRLPAQIEPWLCTEALQVWVREAPAKSAYQRRLAIWLTGVCRLSAHRVGESLCVGTPPRPCRFLPPSIGCRSCPTAPNSVYLSTDRCIGRPRHFWQCHIASKS